MSNTIVTLKKGEGRTIKSGGLWIYDNEIATITGTFKNGDIVIVHDFDGYPMGRGFINQNSKIRIRMMTRKADQEVNEEFLRMRVKNARRDFQLGEIEQDVIQKHMFPLNLKPPKYKESALVCLADKLSALEETIRRR